jgi:hypothetical protein
MARIGFNGLDAAVGAGCILTVLPLTVHSYVFSEEQAPYVNYVLNPAFTPYLVVGAFWFLWRLSGMRVFLFLYGGLVVWLAASIPDYIPLGNITFFHMTPDLLQRLQAVAKVKDALYIVSAILFVAALIGTWILRRREKLRQKTAEAI